LVGGFLADAKGWRWLYWIQLILGGAVWFLMTFTVPETYAPTLLARRAKKLRRVTGDKKHVTEQDLDLRPLSERLAIFLLRPFQLLFGELIVFLISLYMSVLYGLLYMFFIAFPVVYQLGKGYSAGTTGLMFIPLAVGVCLKDVQVLDMTNNGRYYSQRHALRSLTGTISALSTATMDTRQPKLA